VYPELQILTYCAGEVPLQLFDDSSEAPTCQIEKVPAFPHGRSIIMRRSEFFGLGDIPGIVPDVEVDHGSELGLFVLCVLVAHEEVVA
jgi:hypothetical protein